MTRKFIVAEGLYANYGDLAPIPQMVSCECVCECVGGGLRAVLCELCLLYCLLWIQVEMRDQFRVPILLDESLSFGVLGETGRGATEHWGVPVSQPGWCSACKDHGGMRCSVCVCVHRWTRLI